MGGYKNKDLDPKDNAYKNKDEKEYRLDPYDPYKREYFNDPYARYYRTDSKDSEYEMRSILNGYKNKDYKRNDQDLDEKEYFNDPYDPYKREYRSACCPGEEQYRLLCYPVCYTGFRGLGPLCIRGLDVYVRGAGYVIYRSC